MSPTDTQTQARPTKRFVVRYTDEGDQGWPVFEWRCYAYDAEHALDKFYSGEDSDGWKVLSVDRPRDSWGKVVTQFDREAA